MSSGSESKDYVHTYHRPLLYSLPVSRNLLCHIVSTHTIVGLICTVPLVSIAVTPSSMLLRGRLCPLHCAPAIAACSVWLRTLAFLSCGHLPPYIYASISGKGYILVMHIRATGIYPFPYIHDKQQEGTHTCAALPVPRVCIPSHTTIDNPQSLYN